jgi:hypothetical protein
MSSEYVVLVISTAYFLYIRATVTFIIFRLFPLTSTLFSRFILLNVAVEMLHFLLHLQQVPGADFRTLAANPDELLTAQVT